MSDAGHAQYIICIFYCHDELDYEETDTEIYITVLNDSNLSLDKFNNALSSA
jgi:hypothetical protein